MKWQKQILQFVFLIILCFAITGVVYLIFRPKCINLSKYRWELIKDNTTVIKNSKGEVVVGPTIIILYAEYPLIYGYADSRFIIDLQEDKVFLFKKSDLWDFIEYLEKHSITFKQERLVTFYDVYPRAQHYNQYKALDLQKEVTREGRK